VLGTFKLLRNVGQFDSVADGAALPLAKLSLIYAENGRGKTTLAAVLRSLGTGDPVWIAERHRLSALHAPHVVIGLSDGTDAVFDNGAWGLTLAELAIFDDVFVDENVYSGLIVAPGHRQRMHELILGAQGVTITRELEQLAARIERHNSDLRTLSAAVPAAARGPFSVDDFCALGPHPNVDAAIDDARRALAAGQAQGLVQAAALFEPITLPAFDVQALQNVLDADLPALDQDAMGLLERHLVAIGAGGEGWVAEGVRRLNETAAHEEAGCPFCAQSLAGSPVIDSYRAYFSEAYRNHLCAIDAAIEGTQRDHGGDVLAAFERRMRVAVERRQLWVEYAAVPDWDIDSATVASSWVHARETALGLLQAKKADPLSRVPVPNEVRQILATYEAVRQTVHDASNELLASNPGLEAVKEQAGAANVEALRVDLTRLLAFKARFDQDVTDQCDAYLAEKTLKTATEAARAQKRGELDNYRQTAFPGYQTAINQYLGYFNAGFRLDSVTAADTRGGPTCTYNVVINNTPVAVSGGTPAAGTPSFRNTLSAGDRNTLALAFFFASLDRDPNVAGRVVVIDDPVSSLDDHRSLTTVQQVRRLSERVSQVVVMSHNKTFLCRIWDSADRTLRSALQVARAGTGSTLAAWDVDADSETEHDLRHALLRSYAASAGVNDQREVARAIRPVLESYLRVACPEHFPASTLLGPFRNLCNQRVGTANEILSRSDIDELEDLTEYANNFHHDTNPAWETAVINDAELRGFVDRALIFTRP
jgi:wobble nucleotide-excising tRNase